jgi:FkbH-like protein
MTYANTTIKSFNELKKNLKKEHGNRRKVGIALLGDSATQMLVKALKGYGYEAGYQYDIFEADYNQIERQVFDYGSELYASQPDFVIIFQSVQKLQKKFHKTPADKLAGFAEEQLAFAGTLYQTITAKLKTKVIYCNFPEYSELVYGNFANKIEQSFTWQLRKINTGLMELGRELKNLFICDLMQLQAQYGSAFAFDPKLYVTADMVFSLDFLPVVAKNFTDIIAAISGQFKKCLILDLDNTMWGGIIGDDGIENIHVGDLGIGKAFTELQRWAKDLQQRGIILAVCSKNTDHIAREPFEKHPEMVLRLDDIAVFVANWENKADNIRHIQSILEIGFDSMVFLDDNPFERNLVRENIADITVPELPEDPAEYVSFLRRMNLFETASFSENDTSRTKQYQVEAQRREYARSFNTEGDFLKNLEMTSEVKPFDAFTTPRVAQLTMRSNQFNLRTIRYTEEDIREISASGQYLTFSFTLEDRFGDHGLISVIILKKQNERDLFIDTWIMSCRVLKRDMENFVLNRLVEAAKAHSFERLVGEYIPTPKNGIVKDHYQDLGFTQEGNYWVLNLEQAEERPAFIIVKNKQA